MGLGSLSSRAWDVQCECALLLQGKDDIAVASDSADDNVAGEDDVDGVADNDCLWIPPEYEARESKAKKQRKKMDSVMRFAFRGIERLRRLGVLTGQCLQDWLQNTTIGA